MYVMLKASKRSLNNKKQLTPTTLVLRLSCYTFAKLCRNHESHEHKYIIHQNESHAQNKSNISDT